MNWKELRNGQKALPEDEILADLYSLSRKIKSSETGTTMSQIEVGGDKHKNLFSNQFFMNAFGQISFITPGCKIGQCCFCSYGASDVKLTPKIVAEEMDKFKQAILERQERGENVYAILLDSVGSILDSNEFTPDCLEVVFDKLDELLGEVKEIESVGFETHYQTLGSYDEKGKYVASEAIQKLIEFKKKHSDVGTFVVELGFETANGEIRDNLLFKHIDDKTYKESVELLHQNGIEVEANIMATLPFLSQREQIEQSTSSIIEALTPYSENGYGLDSVTLFPLNIRKHTFCDYVFSVQEEFNRKNKTQSPDWLQKEFPIWSMVATLNSLIECGREDLLEKVSVAWFGGRALSEDESEIYPSDWEETYEDFVLYRKNLKGENSRANLVRKMTKNPKYKQFIEAVKSKPRPELDYHERADYIHELISNMNMPYEVTSPCKSNQ